MAQNRSVQGRLRSTNPGGMAELAVRGGRIPNPETGYADEIDGEDPLLARAAKTATGARKKRLLAASKRKKGKKRNNANYGPLEMLANASDLATGARQKLLKKALIVVPITVVVPTPNAKKK